uniref:Uncharacterized protein n=1 Tax=Avena sativa TaxID=4498 RepID=A0ACD5TBA0_AVESA
MLRLRSSILTHILSSSSTSPNSSLLRLLSSTATPTATVPAPAPGISPNPSFAVGDYLVDTCGLTQAQALKASAKLSHLKSPTKPDAVLAFLAGLGLSSADVATLISKDPQLLCAKVDKTLASNFTELTALGLSHPDIARLLSLAPKPFRNRSTVSKLQYYLPLFGSRENLFRALKNGSHLLCSDLERVVKPNVVFLQECGLIDCDIAKLCVNVPMMLATKPERVRAMVACAEGLGVLRGSGTFRHALHAVSFLSEEEIAARVDYTKKTFKWSDAEVNFAISRSPFMLRRTKESLQLKSDFLISKVGLEPAYIARFPALINYSLDVRIRPRYYVVKFLKKNGLLDRYWKFGTIVEVSEKVFVEKFICPHKEAAPHLAQDYAAACRGEVTTRLIFA